MGHNNDKPGIIGYIIWVSPLVLGHIYWCVHSIDVYRAIPNDLPSGTNYCLVCEEQPQKVVEVWASADSGGQWVDTCVKCDSAVETKRSSFLMACLSNLLLPLHLFWWAWCWVFARRVPSTQGLS